MNQYEKVLRRAKKRQQSCPYRGATAEGWAAFHEGFLWAGNGVNDIKEDYESAMRQTNAGPSRKRMLGFTKAKLAQQQGKKAL